MNKFRLRNKNYYVPDMYLEKVEAKLSEMGEEYEKYSIFDMNSLKNKDFIKILIDDERFEDLFIAKDLTFMDRNNPLALLEEPSTHPGRSRNYNLPMGGEFTQYKITNLHDGIFEKEVKKSFRIQICGLGDVGGTLLTGLRLLGKEEVRSIGIYDRNDEKAERWLRESCQILSPSLDYMPPVFKLTEEELFDCDVFIFCVTAGVPALGSEKEKDVRLIQFEKNAAIVRSYAEMAGKKGYTGEFFIVSDPVDQLCMAAYDTGYLKKSSIKGFGLGVMYARAIFHADNLGLYRNEIRAYGPHGDGLRILNSYNYYSKEISDNLTELTRNENITIRNTGFKPYIAPALSSGAMNILACLNNEWHYSSSCLNGIWFGLRNRKVGKYSQYETLPLKQEFKDQLLLTMEKVRGSYSKDTKF